MTTPAVTGCEPGNLGMAHTAMANSLAAANNALIHSYGLLNSNASASWTNAMQQPTFNAANAQRLVTESGGGYVRQQGTQPPGGYPMPEGGG